MKKILFIFTARTSDDRSAWSGTMNRSFMALQRAGYEVDYLCAVRDTKNTIVDKLWWEYWRRIPKMLGKNIRCDETFYSVKIFGETLHAVDYSVYDFVFIPTNIAIVNALPKNITAKLVHLVDATVDSLFEYYSEFSNLLWLNYKEAHVLGKRAFRRSDLLIASSDWCRSNAIRDYGVNPDKIAVIEFGANLNSDDIPAVPRSLDSKSQLNIYWSGVNWERKGGDIALACCDALIGRGHNIKLHVTGIRKEDPLTSHLESLDYVENYGFLNKNKPEEYNQLIHVMENMDIFLFPSKAECSSIALCEANGFALPCFVYDTGGTGNYVVNGENGYMLPLSADGVDFADRIESCINNKELDNLSLGAARRYSRLLNWDTWSERVKKAIESV